jgi:hypothetical protein
MIGGRPQRRKMMTNRKNTGSPQGCLDVSLTLLHGGLLNAPWLGCSAVLRIRIRTPGLGAILTPGIRDPVWEKVSIRIRDEQPGSYFLELRNHCFAFLGLKYLNSLKKIRDRDGDSSDPGWKKVGSGIRDKHPGSATLVQCVLGCSGAQLVARWLAVRQARNSNLDLARHGGSAH